jgi:hypothetical protein
MLATPLFSLLNCIVDPVFVAATHALPFVLPGDSPPLVTAPPVSRAGRRPHFNCPASTPSPPLNGAPRLPPSVFDDLDHAPILSLATGKSSLPPGVPTFSNKAARELWAKDNIDTAVMTQLNQPFGKDRVCQSFTVQAAFRHVLCFLLKSGYLPDSSRAALEAASAPAASYSMLVRTHSLVDFSSLRDPIPQDMPSAIMVPLYSCMFTALLLHYDLSVAAAVRWMGGTHTGAHRDHALIISTLTKAGVDADIIRDLRRVYYFGAPAYINAESTDANFGHYYAYGNHKTILEDVPKTKKAMTKDVRRGYNIVMDQRLALLIPHMHVTPIGMVDLAKIYKEPRPIFDSTFRVHPSSMAINDWVDPANEPEIHFPKSFLALCIWLYNLRISYPDQEIYVADDDVSGAFRHGKYHPNLVALHACVLFGFLFMSTGQTFGDSPSPANFEPMARARQQYAQYLWYQADTLLRASKYMPVLQFQAPPSDTSIFFQSTADSLNQGVFNRDGTRRSPTYDHHVDDNIYGDVKEFLPLGVAASILALYLILGYPGPRNRDSVSWNKFDKFFTHERKMIGYGVNTRGMILFLLDYKRTQLLGLLKSWLAMVDFDLLQCAEMLGHLGGATTTCRWARVLFFGLQNLLRKHLVAQYHKAKGWFDRNGGAARITAALEPGLAKRFDSLVSREVASLLWRSKKRFSITPPVHAELQYLYTYLSDFSNPWEVLIGHVVPRSPTYESAGDASLNGGGAINDSLGFWFDCRWSPRVLRGTKLNPRHPEYVHINCLEFIVLLLQIVACIVYLEDPYDLPPLGLPPDTPPVIPILLALTDNMSSKSWVHRVITSSPRGQALIQIYAALLRRSSIGLQCEHIPGVLNTDPDFISRPNLSLSTFDWYTQIYLNVPRLKSYCYFQPSPELISVLQSRLFCVSQQGLPELPKKLGQFVPGGCTTTGFVTI